MIIVIANSKGGVGKSTLAVHLAAWLHEQGHSVTLADCDTQQSSSEWIREAVPEVKAVRLDNPDMILNELPLLNQETDYVVADGPGSQTETSRALLLRADMAIVPCKASMLEVRALAKATEVLRQAQDIRAGKPSAVIVLSMVGKNYRLTQDMKDAAAALESAAGDQDDDAPPDLRRRTRAGRCRLESRGAGPGGRRRSEPVLPRNPARCLPEQVEKTDGTKAQSGRGNVKEERMAERRALIEGIKTPTSPVDPNKEKAFVFGEKKGKEPDDVRIPGNAHINHQPVVHARVPLSTRMRADFADALKRASLERQLAEVEPNTLQDILEQAVEPWLRSNGYLK